MNQRKIEKAKALLVSKIDVVPEMYSEYNGGILFLAYPRNCKQEDKAKQLSPYYLVDLKTNNAGPFSPAFDLDGFFKSLDNMKKIR